MLTFALRRLALTILAFFVMTFFVWLLTTQDGIYLLHHPTWQELIPARYQLWLMNVLHGDLGHSLRAQQDVLPAMQERTGVTLMLIIPALILQEILALSLGVLASSRFRSLYDRAFTIITLIGASAPVFWVGLVAIEFITIQWQLLPTFGLINYRVVGYAYGTPEYWAYFHANTYQAVVDIVRHLIIPVGVLAFAGISTDGQLIRGAMIEVLNQEYIRAAKARGIKQRIILWRHALRNALLPLFTNIGLQLPRLVFTVALVELTFNLPGLGRLFATAVYTPPNSNGFRLPKDLAVVTAFFLLIGIIALLSSLLTDFAYALADPRIRQSVSMTQTIAGNPFTAKRPLLHLGKLTLQTRTVVIAATVFAVGILGIAAYQSITRPAPPSYGGIWVGTFSVPGPHLSGTLFVQLTAKNGGDLPGAGGYCLIDSKKPGLLTYHTFSGDGNTDNVKTIGFFWKSDIDYFALGPDPLPRGNQTMTLTGLEQMYHGVEDLQPYPTTVQLHRQKSFDAAKLQAACH